MKNILYIVNTVLAVAVIVLFILFFTSGKNNSATGPSLKFEKGDSAATLPIAYVNIDTLLVKYNYAKDANDVLMRKFESTRASLNQKRKNFIAEQQDFNTKYQNNAFLSPERAQAEAERIQKIGMDLEQTMARMEQEFSMEQHKVNSQLADSVRICIKEYNLSANYQMIFSNAGLDNILFAKDKYDITEAVLTLLNSRYNQADKK
ncbi:outer membrane protein [Dysgonomonas sp. PH5-45]|uniref:OmpH family outer membrane protein n=1 Tax=unclassified Dysgonomonas TaxID=2630389 RepID=UPI002474F949|nr:MULTISPECIES: OmpH family outer membrane protein [unclassified Dysgonomonas]MDH6354998.1 outer membrane protein [Dysgonomonas sp. PH5-45]MDH6387877.1 outer membrane protein [Dysgonomonas sp. PH5-37]